MSRPVVHSSGALRAKGRGDREGALQDYNEVAPPEVRATFKLSSINSSRMSVHAGRDAFAVEVAEAK